MADYENENEMPPLDGATAEFYVIFDTINPNRLTDYNEYVRPRSLRNLYNPRYSIFDILQMYYLDRSDDILNEVQNNSFFNDPYVKPIITNEQINKILERTPQIKGTCPDDACNI